jgi:TonB family protein
MGVLLAYLLKSACCLVMFYLFYKVLLSKETFHTFNRFALLGVLLICAILPFIAIKTETGGMAQGSVIVGNLTMQSVAEERQSFQWQWLLLIVYMAGFLTIAMKSILSYIRLAVMIHKAPSTSIEGSRVRLILFDRTISPCSWMNYIILSKVDYERNGHAILTHEMAHVRRLHSADMLVADICIVLQWFNPAAWLVKRELQNIHEYEADEAVLKAGVDAKSYQMLLIRKAVGKRLYSITNSFNHSSLKKRITMMLKKDSNPWARLKYAYVLPLAALSVAAFASPEMARPLDDLSTVKVSDLSAYLHLKGENSLTSSLNVSNSTPGGPQRKGKKTNSKDSGKVTATQGNVVSIPEELPSYPGGTAQMFAFISKNLSYPKDAVKAKKEGRVIVQFVIKADGAISDVKVIRQLYPSCDKEAVRVVSLMTRWIPGKDKGKPVSVRFTLPIVFKLNDTASAGSAASSNTSSAAYGQQNNEAEKESTPSAKTYEVVDVEPQYKGGFATMFEYLKNNLRYPEEAKKAKKQGTVIVQFIVDKTGTIRDVIASRGIDSEMDAEAIRVVSSMPRWIPGKENGKDVSVKYTLPIKFRLN